MNIIRTIDLWTEQNPNHIECFSGAFVDGFDPLNQKDEFAVDLCKIVVVPPISILLHSATSFPAE